MSQNSQPINKLTVIIKVVISFYKYYNGKNVS